MHRFQISNIFFTVFFILFIIIGAVERTKATLKDKTSIPDKKWLTLVPMGTYIGIIVLGIIEYFVNTRTINYFISTFGIVTYISGAVLRNFAINAFNGNWNIHVNAENINYLVKTGPYKYLRHPYYLAVIVELFGLLMISCSYYSMVAILMVQFPVILIRIYYEEENLLKKFGVKYQLWKRKTAFFVPFATMLYK